MPVPSPARGIWVYRRRTCVWDPTEPPCFGGPDQGRREGNQDYPAQRAALRAVNGGGSFRPHARAGGSRRNSGSAFKRCSLAVRAGKSIRSVQTSPISIGRGQRLRRCLLSPPFTVSMEAQFFRGSSNRESAHRRPNDRLSRAHFGMVVPSASNSVHSAIHVEY
jgi:hypothetical protein